MLILSQDFVGCAMFACVYVFDSVFVSYSLLNSFQRGFVSHLGLGFRYHLKAFCCKRKHIPVKYTIHFFIDTFCGFQNQQHPKVGFSSFLFWHPIIYLFISLFGRFGGCLWDKGSWRRLIFKRTSVICCCRQSALSFAAVKEGSQRFKG